MDDIDSPYHNEVNSLGSFELMSKFKMLNFGDTSNQSMISTDIDMENDTDASRTTVSQDDDTGSDNSIIRGLSHTAQSFRALGKIVHFLRKRYLTDGGVHPLTFEQILEQTKQININAKIKEWLEKEAMCNHKRIEVSCDGSYYQFKPAYKLKSLNDLIELLKDNDIKGLGGILEDDVKDSLPNYRKISKKCDPRILVLKRPLDRKSMLYYIDHEMPDASDTEMQEMWRSLGLEDIEEVYEPEEENHMIF